MDLVVVLVVVVAELHVILAVFLIVFNFHIGSLGGRDTGVGQSDGLGLILADDGAGLLSGLFSCPLGGLFGCFLSGLFSSLLGGLLSGFLRCLLGYLFGGRLGGFRLNGGLVFFAAGQDLAGGGVDLIVVFVITEAELHFVVVLFPVVFSLQDNGICLGCACMIQGDGLGFVHAEGCGFGFGCDHDEVRLFVGDIGCSTSGDDGQGKDQGDDGQGLFHGRSLLSDILWYKNAPVPAVGTGGSFCIVGYSIGQSQTSITLPQHRGMTSPSLTCRILWQMGQ